MVNSTTSRLIIPTAAINAFIAVGAGAFAAHGLKGLLSADYLDTFKTAADYQMIHAIGLLLIGILNQQNASDRTAHRNNIAAAFMFTGIILFSGSLYLLTLTGTRWLGMITPLGGTCFLIAWLMLTVNYWPRMK
jgi:uncharacterized membrane protein YgdD (TMEM256/DUF423 family)